MIGMARSELPEDVGMCCSEGVDALRIITNHSQTTTVAMQQLNDFNLQAQRTSNTVIHTSGHMFGKVSSMHVWWCLSCQDHPAGEGLQHQRQMLSPGIYSGSSNTPTGSRLLLQC